MTKEKFKKKWENYWFYYKIHTIVAVVLILIVALLVKQCSDRVNPDITVMIVSRTVNLSDAQTASIQNMLDKYTTDINGDGRRVAECDCYYFGDAQNAQMNYALQAKLIANVSDAERVLYITDDGYYKELSKTGSLFDKLSNIDTAAPNSDRVELSKLPDFKISGMPDGFEKLSLSVRSFKNMNVDTSGKNKSYTLAVNILKNLLKNAGL